jgi:pSer/pThr/pTyr-binding forkhead associated (FHA) protein
LSPTFEPVFNLVRSASADMPEPDTSHAGHLESADIEDDDISPAEIPSNGSTPDRLGIRLVLAGRRLRAALGAEEIAVHELPFRIGRAASGEGKDTYDVVHLAITDARPFNLSRRHFSIEEENGALLVRDCGSYHGTTLNGQILGGEGRPSSAPLMSGKSERVAGRADSPFRFRILV